MQEWIAVDTETTGLDRHDDKLICFGWWKNTGSHGSITDPEELKSFIKDNENNFFVLHGGSFDQYVVHKFCGVWLRNDFDLRLAASILKDRPSNLKLETVAAHFLGVPPWKEDTMYENMGGALVEDVSGLCIVDCEYTLRTALKVYEKLIEQQQDRFFLDIIMPISDLLSRASRLGMRIDTEAREELHSKLLMAIADQEDRLYAEYSGLVKEYEDARLIKDMPKMPKNQTEKAMERYNQILDKRRRKHRFNFSSPPQVLWLLKDKLNFPCVKERSKSGVVTYGVGEEVLTNYKGQHPIISDLLFLRNLVKKEEFCEIYASCKKDDGRLHGKYNLDVARTFRTSMNDPNLQQVPRSSEFRSLFIPADGYVYSIMDFGQIEPRLAAHFSQDVSLLNIFHTGVDFYSASIKSLLNLPWTPEEIHKQHKEVRDAGKEVGLSILYNTGPSTICNIIKRRLEKVEGIPPNCLNMNYIKAHEFIKGYFRAYPGLLALREGVSSFAKEHGYITTLLGRRVYLDAARVDFIGLNTLFQTSASDLAGFSQTLIDVGVRKYGIDARFVHFVHDEGIWEVNPKDADNFIELSRMIMEQVMAQRFKLTVPLKVDIKIGTSWADK